MRPLCAECQRRYETQWRAQNTERLQQAREKRAEAAREYQAKYNRENWARYIVSRLKPKCQKKGIPFDLDKHLDELNQRRSTGLCELTGLPLRDTLRGHRTWDSASLDRINPADGYVYSNVRIVCFGMNAALGDWGGAVFSKIVSAYLARKT